MERTKINTVIFDMDGTVLDTLSDLAASVNFVLREHGMPEHERDRMRLFFGNGIRYAFRCAVPEDTDDAVVDKMLPLFFEHYGKHCMDMTKPYEGIPKLMKDLSDKGMKVAIVSNKVDFAVKELSERFFPGLVTLAVGEREGVRRKPAPDMVDAALAELGSSRNEAVYVGDSEVDLETAENSGLPCIAVLWGFRDRERLERCGATHFAKTPSDVLDIILDYYRAIV